MDGQITYRGLTIGAGTDYLIQEVDGLFARSVALNTPDLPRGHGGLVGASFHDPRVIPIELIAVGEKGTDFAGKRNAIRSAFQPLVDSEDPLVFDMPGEDAQRVFARCSRFAAPANWESDAGGTVWATFNIEMVASDPAIYDDSLLTLTLSPFTSSAGFSWPAVWPISWGAAGAGGGETITNTGDWETWPTFKINGPTSGTMTNPIIESVTRGEKIALTANGGASLTSGQVLIVETHPARRSIAFSTGASRRGKLSSDSDWFPLDPGSNELRFRASGSTTGATVDVEARSARI